MNKRKAISPHWQRISGISNHISQSPKQIWTATILMQIEHRFWARTLGFEVLHPLNRSCWRSTDLGLTNRVSTWTSQLYQQQLSRKCVISIFIIRILVLNSSQVELHETTTVVRRANYFSVQWHFSLLSSSDQCARYLTSKK